MTLCCAFPAFRAFGLECPLCALNCRCIIGAPQEPMVSVGADKWMESKDFALDERVVPEYDWRLPRKIGGEHTNTSSLTTDVRD